MKMKMDDHTAVLLVLKFVRFRTIGDAWSQRRVKPLRTDDRDGLNELCAVVSYVFEIN